MVIVSIIITFGYLFLIGSFVWGFNKVNVFNLTDLPAKTSFSVVIPFRNEAENLPELLHSISQLEYPKHLFEIIFVDDDSHDDSVEIIENFLDKSGLKLDIKAIKNQRQSNAPKKDAITTAAKQSKNDWIITTDADCILPKYWLDSFDEFIQRTHVKCVVGPVTYSETDSFLKRFQFMDILSLQGATIGGFGIKKPFMCNGANLGYEKSLFESLNGFKGNTNIASGDDIFLLEKVVKNNPKDVGYLKCEQAIVITKAVESWHGLIEQRLRWASKASSYNNAFGKITGIIVLLTNALILSLALLVTLGEFKVKSLLYILVIKFNIDFLLIYKMASYFNKREVLISYVTSFIIYPFFSVYIAFLSAFKKYKWKERTFRK